MSLTFGSLFSGIGGFDLGMERAGLQALWQCENNKDCQRVLKRHWPNVRLYNDVKEINRTNTASPDVIIGGFPCQDLSVAGKREGLAGERSGLWSEFHRIIKELKPRWAVIENVPGLLSSNSGRDFAVILRGLAECGYHAAWRVLDAQYFGVAQRRRRVFVVASLDGSCAQILFESESGAWDSPPSREAGARVAGTTQNGIGIAGSELGYALRANPSHSGDKGDGGINTNFVVFQQNTRDEVRLINGDGQIAGALSAEAGMKQQNYLASTLNSGGNDGGFRSEPGEHLVISFPGMAQSGAGWAPPSMPVDSEKSGPLDTKRAQCIAFTERTRAEGRTFEAQEDLAYALTNPGSGGRTHSRQIAGAFGVRRLTPVECERLQGFPIQEKCVIMDVCLDHQNNSASVEIQSLKSPKPVGIAERTGLLSVVRYAEMNLNPSDQSNSELARKTVLINCGENRVAILNQEKCFLSATFAGGRNLFPQLTRNEDFALLVAGLNSIAEQITLTGKAASPTSGVLSIVPRNGKILARLSGSGMMQLVNDATIGSITNKGLLKSITSSPIDIKISEPILITLFSSVLSAISGYIPPEILKSNSFRIEVNSSFGWTFPQSDSARYRQLGNAVAVPCSEWIGRRIVALAT